MNGLKVTGSKMNGLKAIARLRNLASIAMLSGAIFTIFLVPAYGQQEIDPTWYDPTPSAAAPVDTAQAQAQAPAQPLTTAHALQPIVTHRYLPANNHVSQAAHSGNLRAKNAKSDRSVTGAARNTQTLAADKKPMLPTLIASGK
jgi:hypothetical protein